MEGITPQNHAFNEKKTSVTIKFGFLEAPVSPPVKLARHPKWV